MHCKRRPLLCFCYRLDPTKNQAGADVPNVFGVPGYLKVGPAHRCAGPALYGR
jgi:hypothetical protein